jgi:hypothetical protein
LSHTKHHNSYQHTAWTRLLHTKFPNKSMEAYKNTKYDASLRWLGFDYIGLCIRCWPINCIMFCFEITNNKA